MIRWRRHMQVVYLHPELSMSRASYRFRYANLREALRSININAQDSTRLEQVSPNNTDILVLLRYFRPVPSQGLLSDLKKLSPFVAAIEALRKQGVSIILDLHDSPFAFYTDKIFFRNAAKQVDVFTVTCRKMAEEVLDFCPSARVRVVPDQIDPFPVTPDMIPNRPVLVWIGSSDNLPALEWLYKEGVFDVLHKVQPFVLMVISDQKPDWLPFYGRFEPWSSPEKTYALLGEASVGLAIVYPLRREEDSTGLLWRWNMVKSNNKVLTYLAAGLSVVCSQLPSYLDSFRDEPTVQFAENVSEWKACLHRLLTSYHKQAGQERVIPPILAKYSPRSTAKRWRDVFEEVLEKSNEDKRFVTPTCTSTEEVD